MHRRALILAALIACTAPTMALASGGGEKKKVSGESYLVIQTLTGTTLRGGGKRGVMTVDCGLDVQDAALRKLADQSLPRLRAAYAQTVRAYAAGLSPGVLPNADFLARTMQRQTDVELGRPGARLLLGAIVIN